MRVTVVGAKGIIGSHLVDLIKRQPDLELIETDRGYKIQPNFDYGIVVYCAGITVNYQNYGTVDAHVVHLNEWLERAMYSKIIYLSSTRIYNGLTEGNEATERFVVSAGDFYNQTKLLGESIVRFSCRRPYVIVRPSHVLAYTPHAPTFFWTVLRQAREQGKIELEESAEMSRNYIVIYDLVRILLFFARSDCSGIYNVCSASNVSNHEIVEIIKNFAPFLPIQFGPKNLLIPQLSNQNLMRIYDDCLLNVLSVMHEFCELFLDKSEGILKKGTTK